MSAHVVSASDASRLTMRAAVVVTATVGAVCVVVATVLGGALGALGAALGAVIVVGFFATGQWAVSRLLSSSPELALSGGLAIYLGQVLVLFLLIVLLKGATWLDPKAFAATIVVGTITWVLVQIWGTQHYKVVTVEPATVEAGYEVP